MRATAVWLLVVLVGLGGCGGGKPAPIRVAQPAPLPSKGLAARAADGHLVQAGETLWSIAFRYGLDAGALADWNGLADPDVIRAGTVLRLTPPARSSKAAVGPSRASDTAQPVAWDWPARGPLLKRFDNPPGSKGLDIAGERGSPVRATAAGRVMYAGDGLRGYGKLIIIKHSDTLLSAYAHQDRLLVAEGDRVARGQVVGRMGDSDAHRVMLHFEIREQGKPVDPMKYLPN